MPTALAASQEITGTLHLTIDCMGISVLIENMEQLRLTDDVRKILEPSPLVFNLTQPTFQNIPPCLLLGHPLHQPTEEIIYEGSLMLIIEKTTPE